MTKTTIRLGIDYVDLAAIRNLINLNQGSYPDAYTAIIDYINAHGGINGRKIVPYFEAVDPLGTAPSATACTALTENDTVFAAVGLFLGTGALCYLNTHDTPIVGFYPLTQQETQQAKAPWFLDALNDNDAIPKEIDTFNSEGVFKGEKVAVVGQTDDESDMDSFVLPELKKLGVDVVQTAINDAVTTDDPALNAQYALIAQKFQSAGANEVVAVGDAGNSWPISLGVNHSTYAPRLVTTSYSVLDTYLTNASGYSDTVMSDAVSASVNPSTAVVWNDPLMKSCVAEIRAAYPKDAIGDPIDAAASAPTTWTAPEQACELMALFVDIAKAAGPNLNNATFLHAGESLTNVTLPGAGGPLHYGPGHQDGDGPVFVYNWSKNGKTFTVTPTG